MPILRELRITNAQRARSPRTEIGSLHTVVAGQRSRHRLYRHYRVTDMYQGRSPDFSDTCWLKMEPW